MTIYQKLNAARSEFHTLKLKKTGHNKFAGYYYFELADFLIPALEVFAKHGLCAIVGFEADTATMRIVDAETGETVTITSPMGSAALKGCHEVQNIGAVETYQRRYLWVAALEIVEHDALDSGQADDTSRKPDVAAILKNISGSVSMEILKGNYEAAMQMLPEAHHAAIKKATSARKAELAQNESEAA